MIFTVAILDENSNIVGFSGRSLHENSKSKYINSRDSEVFNKSNILYGLDRASENIKLKSQAVVVEGYFDCISGYDKGYQLKLLEEPPKSSVFLFMIIFATKLFAAEEINNNGHQ